MAGGIDLHTHIGGGKTNIARMLMPEGLCKSNGFEYGNKENLFQELLILAIDMPKWDTLRLLNLQ